jgi:hypothetical protein
VAALLLAELRLEEIAHVAPLAQARLHFLQQLGASRDEARFQEARVDGHVLHRLLDALRDGAHAVAGLQAAIPQGADEFLDRRIGRAAIGHQDEDVDIGMREERAAAVASDRYQREGLVVDRLRPEPLQQLIDQRGVRCQRPRRIGPPEIPLLQLLAMLLDPRACLRRAGARFSFRFGDGRWCARNGNCTWHRFSYLPAKLGGAGVPADCVRIS